MSLRVALFSLLELKNWNLHSGNVLLLVAFSYILTNILGSTEYFF